MSETHAAVWDLAQRTDIHTLWELLTPDESKSLGKSVIDVAAFQQRIFLLVNPACVENNEEVSATGKASAVYNCVEVMYKEALVAHVPMNSETFVNIGGMKGLMLVLRLLAEAATYDPAGRDYRNRMTARILQTLDWLLKHNKGKGRILLERDDMVLKMRYLLEKLAERGGLGGDVQASVINMQETLFRLYPSVVGKYVENVSMNFDIWGRSPLAVQSSEIESVQQLLLGDIEKVCNRVDMIDCFLGCIESLAISRSHNKQHIEPLSRAVTRMLIDNLNEQSMARLLSYLNLLHLQQRSRGICCYTSSIRTVLGIFLEVFVTCTPHFRYPGLVKPQVETQIRTAAKKALRSPIIAALMSILTHYATFSEPAGRRKSVPVGDQRDSRLMSTGSNPEIRADNSPSTATTELEDDENAMMDEIMAVCLHVLLNLDWTFLKEIVKTVGKDQSHASGLMGYLIKNFVKTPGLNHIGIFGIVILGDRPADTAVRTELSPQAEDCRILGSSYIFLDYGLRIGPTTTVYALRLPQGKTADAGETCVYQQTVEIFDLEEPPDIQRTGVQVCLAHPRGEEQLLLRHDRPEQKRELLHRSRGMWGHILFRPLSDPGS